MRTSARSPNPQMVIRRANTFAGSSRSSAENNEANEVAGIALQPPNGKEIPADAESPLERRRN